MKFRTGDFSLDDALWSGRPVEVDSDQIETLIENNQHSTIWERANIQINKVISENENVSFTLWKKCNRLFGQLSTMYPRETY